MMNFQMNNLGTNMSASTVTKRSNGAMPIVALANPMRQTPALAEKTATPSPKENHCEYGTYGTMTSEGYTFTCNNFHLENGVVLPKAQLRYRTFGEINRSRDNVIVVCHAFTGDSSLDEWWGGLLGPGNTFDTQKYFIVCCNILGSCYGSTGPTSINPSTGKPYLKDFPDVSVKDTVRLQLLLLKEELKASSIKCVIGGSFGGMQTMEFVVQGGSAHGDYTTENGGPYVRSAVAIACGSAHAAWQIAFSESQRQAIYADPNWDRDPLKATKGLSVARQIAMISYRGYKTYREKFGRKIKGDTLYGNDVQFNVKSYLKYQGNKFLSRFDPITYVKLSEQMDSHDVGRDRGGIASALQKVDIPVLVLGINSDILYPPKEQKDMASLLPNAECRIIHSDACHDGFLLEQEEVGQHVSQFLDNGGSFIRKSQL